MYRIVLVLLAAVSGSVSLFLNGSCPITSGSMAPNNFRDILGMWYQVQRIPNEEENHDCSTTFFGGTTVANSISNRQVYNGREIYRNGTITLMPLEPHRFSVQFRPNEIFRQYYLIGTNFTSYALLGRCDERTYPGNVNRTTVFAWKLSRTNTLSAADNLAINKLLADIPPLANTFWRTTRHSFSACQLKSVTDGAGSVVASLVLIVTALFFVFKDCFRE